MKKPKKRPSTEILSMHLGDELRLVMPKKLKGNEIIFAAYWEFLTVALRHEEKFKQLFVFTP